MSTRTSRKKESIFGFAKSTNEPPQCSIRITTIQILNMVEKQSPKHYDDDDATFGLNWEEKDFDLDEDYCPIVDEGTCV